MIDTLKIPLPQAPSAEVLSTPELTIKGDSGRGGPVLVTYDYAQQCGAVFFERLNCWTTYSPIPFKEFFSTLIARGIFLPKSADTKTWLIAQEARAADVVAQQNAKH